MIIRRKDVVHVLLETVVVVLSPLLDASWHLLVDLLDIFSRAVGGFERLPGIEKRNTLDVYQST